MDLLWSFYSTRKILIDDVVKDIMPHTTLLKDIKSISANHEMLVESEKEGIHIISTSTVQKRKKMMSEETMRKGRENQLQM